MTKAAQRSWVWRFERPPEEIWPLLADTARLNEAAALPKHEIEERPQEDGSVLYLGRLRKGPFRIEWRERPTNWISDRWFEHCREFRNGPLKRLCATLTIAPDAAGSRAEFTIEAEAASLLGRAMLVGGFMRSAGRTFSRLAEEARQFAAGARATPFAYEAPAPSPETVGRVETMLRRIDESGHGHGLSRRLAEHVLTAQEVDLTHVRPLRLARLWNVPKRHVIELCLEATRAGLLNLRWDLLCPRCRVAKAMAVSLDALPRGAHCPTCNISYDRDFSRNVELSFQPAPAVRSIAAGEYCLFGPMSTPHIRLQLTVPAGAAREIEAALAPGAYRLRTLEPGPALDLTWEDGGFPEAVLESEELRFGPPVPAGMVRLVNRADRERTFVIEERAWVRDALTADRVTALQAFRDLFSDQVLRPGDEVAVRRVALMFTDLQGSTALYSRIGDASAYHLVRDHFAFLTGIVRDHNGAIVKTIGDSVMAAFIEPADALRAGLDVQRAVAGFNAGRRDDEGAPIALKLGLHEGPCIAVTLNDRLDYFGSTVNLAARLQDESEGGDIVLSAALAEDRDVAALLAPLAPGREAARLKGFAEPISFLRLRP